MGHDTSILFLVVVLTTKISLWSLFVCLFVYLYAFNDSFTMDYSKNNYDYTIIENNFLFIINLNINFKFNCTVLIVLS